MNRITALLLCMIMLFSLCACGSTTVEAQVHEEPAATGEAENVPTASFSNLQAALPILSKVLLGMTNNDIISAMTSVDISEGLDVLDKYDSDKSIIGNFYPYKEFGDSTYNSIVVDFDDNGLANEITINFADSKVEDIVKAVADATGVEGTDVIKDLEGGELLDADIFSWIMDNYRVEVTNYHIMNLPFIKINYTDGYLAAAKTDALLNSDFLESSAISNEAAGDFPVLGITGVKLDESKIDAADLIKYLGTTALDPSNWENEYGCSHFKGYYDTFIYPITPSFYLNTESSSSVIQFSFTDDGILCEVYYSSSFANDEDFEKALLNLDNILEGTYGEPNSAYSYAGSSFEDFENRTEYDSCSGCLNALMINGMAEGESYHMSYGAVDGCDEFQIVISENESFKNIACCFSVYQH